MNKTYFNWLCELIRDKTNKDNSNYKKLLKRLYDTDFIFSMSNDSNRAEDGLNLRYRFENEFDVSLLKKKAACSVLEMMVALAVRCEEDIMEDEEIGNRTSLWFWDMIASLGLNDMSDERYNERITDNKINKFLTRKYDKNGKGGLFTIKNSDRDLREMEIWYQMYLYLNTIE